jgi:hypothetical protein
VEVVVGEAVMMGARRRREVRLRERIVVVCCGVCDVGGIGVVEDSASTECGKKLQWLTIKEPWSREKRRARGIDDGNSREVAECW